VAAIGTDILLRNILDKKTCLHLIFTENVNASTWAHQVKHSTFFWTACALAVFARFPKPFFPSLVVNSGRRCRRRRKYKSFREQFCSKYHEGSERVRKSV
jgi:hypothetical protein